MAIFAQGTTIKKVSTLIVGATTINAGLTADVVDVTDQDSTLSFREYIAGLRTGGQITFDINYDPDAASHAALITDLKAGTSAVYNIAMTDPTPTTYSVTAVPVGFEITAPIDAQLTASVTLQTTGVVTVS